MNRYVIRRTVQSVVVIWAVGTLVFFMLRAVPGDPIRAMLADVDPTAADVIRAKLGLDQPAHVQYILWLSTSCKRHRLRTSWEPTIWAAICSPAFCTGRAFRFWWALLRWQSPWQSA